LVVHVGAPRAADVVGGNTGIGDPGVSDDGGNKQELEAIGRGDAVERVEQGFHDAFVVRRELGTEFINKIGAVVLTRVVHRGISIARIPPNGRGTKLGSGHGGGLKEGRNGDP